MARPRWSGLVGLVLAGGLGWACGGGVADAEVGAPTPDTTGVDTFDTISDAPLPDSAETSDETVAPPPWMPAAPVEAEQVFPELMSSEGLAVDGQGRFLLTANDALLRLDQAGNLETLAAIPKAPGMPTVGFAGVAWHPSWGAVFAQTTGDRLYQWTDADGLVQIGDPIGKGPNGVLFDGEGHLLVSLSTDGAVVRLDTPEAPPVTLVEGISFANGLALSPDGATLYVASTSKGAVYQVPLAGESPYVATVLSNDALFAGADGLLLSPDGWLLVASWSKGRVVAYELATGATRVVSDAPAENLRHVANLAFGPGGDLDAGCLFATRLNEAGLVRICP
jgi:sugar lactone lactonase YvrE